MAPCGQAVRSEDPPDIQAGTERLVSSEVKWIDQRWSVSPELFRQVMRPWKLTERVWGALGGKGWGQCRVYSVTGRRTDVCVCGQQLICIGNSLEFCSLLRGCAGSFRTIWKLPLWQYYNKYLEILEIYHPTEILPYHLFQGGCPFSISGSSGIAGNVVH